MFDEITISRAIDTVMKKLDEVNRYYIIKIAEQIAAIGEMNPTSINRIVLMTEWGADIRDITLRLQEATALTEREMMQIFQKALDDSVNDPRFATALQHKSLTPQNVAKLEQYARAISVQTAEQITNLSNTTAIAENYRAAVDKAVLAVSSGLTDYKSATRDVIREVGYNGMQTQYASGYHRRLDSAVRQNIIDATNQIAQNASDAMSDALGYDAKEISAHMMSAPDHEPIQGRVFLNSEFDKMQNGLPFEDIDGNRYEAIRRPIGEWNCKHFAMGFSTQYSKRMFSDEQLTEWAAKNNEGCEIEGKHYTTYGASQLMRELETEVRREREAAIAAQAAGDDTLRRQCQDRINALMQKYRGVAKTAGIKAHPERTMVPGFKMMK